MQAVQQIAQAQGFQVLGLGPSAQAVDALKASGIDTITSQRALIDGKFWGSVDKRTVIVLDEAGLVDARSMQLLMQRAAERGARFVVVGDQKQFSSVEAGRALYQLAKEAKVDGSLSRLDEMRRGRTEEMRALHLAARDDPAKALQALLENGHVTALQTDSKRFKAIARDYAAIPREERSQTLVLTGKNDDRKAINAAIRERLGITGTGRNFSTFEADDFTAAQTKQLGSYALGATVRFERDAGKFKRGEQVQVIERHADHVILERKNGKKAPFYPNKEAGKGVTIGAIEQAEFAVGDRARVTANDKEKGVSNGDRGEVMEITESSMTLRLDSGRTIKLDTKAGVLNLRHGYAQTGHSAQGATAIRVLLHLPSTDTTIDHNALYTNLTRAGYSVHVYTDAKGGRRMSVLMQSVTKSRARELVTELINQSTTKEGATHDDRNRTNKPNVAAIGKEPPPAARGRLRALSELDMEQNGFLNKSANISAVSFVKFAIIDEHKQGVTHDDRNRANKPNVAAIGKEPPPAARGRLRALSELGVARLGGGNQVLLPGDVHHQLDQH
jgi:ATP-dependent exoDNAse (exonuclease V) alpha subunit